MVSTAMFLYNSGAMYNGVIHVIEKNLDFFEEITSPYKLLLF